MSDERYPVVDPDTGELLANDPEEAAALTDQLCAELVGIERAIARRAEVVRLLGQLLEPERPWAEDGWAVALKPAARPIRRVVPTEVERHREALTPLGLGPRERTVVVVDYPRVSELTSPAARAALARLGLAPEALMHQGEPGPDQVVVHAPEHAEARR
jgi:hypothetical protein